MSEVKVNKLTPRTNCGTVTLGDSGDTFTIPSGVTITNNGTQTGFGREGSVNWQTGSIKTSTFTAVSGEGYFVDTSSGAVTANLPAGSGGAIVSFSDYTRTFGTNTLTVTPNGSEKIGGSAASAFLNVNGQAATFVYVDGTEGWINVQNAEDTEIGVLPAFVAATGGNCVTTCGDFKSHIFTGPGTFCVSNAGNSFGSNTVDYLVVAGGGGGGQTTPFGGTGAGAGGAGGFRLSNTTCMPAPLTSPLAAATAIPVTATGIPITVGGGGAGSPSAPGFRQGTSGSNSIFSTITSAGGGGGGSGCGPVGPGVAGGSGGGASAGAPGPATLPGGAGNTPPTNPAQGSAGGSSAPGTGGDNGGAGGGGAAAVGGNATNNSTAGPGGAGSFVLNGNGFAGTKGTTGPVSDARYFSGGGGGGSGSGPSSPGPGGAGGGGNGANQASSNAGNGSTNTGGGGGGGNYEDSFNGGTGGSGIVIIRYKFQ